MKGTIFNIQKFCVHDGDGIRTCVFLKGCLLRCLWCHNPEGLSAKPQLIFRQEKCTACGRCLAAECAARSLTDGRMHLSRQACTACGKCAALCLADACEIIGFEASAEEVFAEVLRDRMFYDSTGGGLTVSGGEPSMQPEFTLALLKMAQAAGIGRAVESCGIGPRAFYEAAADMGCTFLYDLKCMDPEKHRILTGADNSRILENLLYLFSRGADVILRLPLIPGINDADEDLDALCRFLQCCKGQYRHCEIMPYHTLGTGKARQLGENTPLTHPAAGNDDITRWKTYFDAHGLSVRTSQE